MAHPLFLTTVAVLLLGSPLAIRADEPSTAEREIRALEAAVSRAVVQADREFFEKHLADDFTHTSHSGRFVNRVQWLEGIKPGRSLYKSYDVEDLVVRIYRDTAVATGRSAPTGTNSRGEPITGKYRFTRVWVKREGKWQVVAFQGTRIDQP